MAKAMSAALAASFLLGGAPALAVGDPPVHLDQRQATEVYRQLRFLLATDHGHCAAGQVARSGLITGGGNPMGGSQTTVISFSQGAKLKVVRMFENRPKPSVTIHISCS